VQSTSNPHAANATGIKATFRIAPYSHPLQET